MCQFYFSTVASNPYLLKLLAMHQSLEKHHDDYHLCILCIDSTTYHILKSLNLSHATCIHLCEIEDQDLLVAKSNRTFLEYAWTLKPCFLYYVMNHFKNAKYYAHLDSDLYFYDHLKKIYSENSMASLFLTHHHNSEDFLFTYPLTGTFNTGFVGCKNDTMAHSAIKWWKDACIQWCYKTMDTQEKRFGDQRYVERWLHLFKNVHIVRSKGANVAIWNIKNYHLALKDHKLYVDDDPLIFYHFSGLSLYNEKEFNLASFSKLPKDCVQTIYRPYLLSLSKIIQKIRTHFPQYTFHFTKKNSIPNTFYYKI